jgi:transposase
MKFIQGIDRKQLALFPTCLDDSLDADNEVRLIDPFVDSLDLKSFGFDMDYIDNGRPAYHPGDLLKLFIYGYLNRIRSSRALEKECRRNIELIWLLKGLVPDHNTISNFRRDNPKAIKKVFRATVQMARHFELIGGKLLAGDSTKFRAQNSKKNNFNQKKIERHLAYIEEKLAQYLAELDQADEDTEKQSQLSAEIAKHEQRKVRYESLREKLVQTGQEQISTSDPDSRQMIVRNHITEVAYNVQASVDAKNCIPIDYKVTSNNDSKAMGNMLQRAKSILGTNGFTALYDKGYHTGSEFGIVKQIGVEVLVAIPAIPRSSQSPDTAFNVENFHYDANEDSYTCLQGHKLTSNGSWYRGNNYKFRQYKTRACKTCPVRFRCTTSRNGKIVQRSEYTQLLEQNRARVEKDRAKYKRRQAIVEHPFGTIKRQWDYGYIMTKRGIDRASADIGLIFTTYNLRRIFNLIDHKYLREYLRRLKSYILQYKMLLEWFLSDLIVSEKLFCKIRFSGKRLSFNRIWVYI